MKTNLIKSAVMLMALAAVVFTSCSKNDEALTPPENVPVKFTSLINQAAIPTGVMTRASGSTWASGDKVGIFMVDTGTTTIAEGAENREYTTTGTNSFTAVLGNEIYYPVDGSGVDFIAYYPYKKGQTLSATYPVNVAVQTSQADIDLMYSNDAVKKTKANPSITMTFNHMLSKVIVKATPGDGLTSEDLAAMTVKVKNMNTAALFNLKTGTLDTYSTPADITVFPVEAGSKYEAIVLPAAFTTGQLIMEFALNNTQNEVFKRVNTAAENFEPGKIYNYTVTVKRTGVTVTCTINDWTAGPDRNGNAE